MYINDPILKKSLKKGKKFELCLPEDICHVCQSKLESLQKCICKITLKCCDYFEKFTLNLQRLHKCECEKVAAYRLL